MSSLRIAALAFLSISLAVSARAQERWVDAVNGSNMTGDGSLAQPWQTITFALTQPVTTLHVLPGTYDSALGETFPIELPTNLELLGSGSDLTIIRANEHGNVLQVYDFDGTAIVQIDGFTVTRAVPAQSDYYYDWGILLSGHYYPEDDVIHVEVSRCVVEFHDIGVLVSSPVGSAWVHDCVVRHNSWDGIRANMTGQEGVFSPRIENNVVTNNGGSGISLYAKWPRYYPWNFDYPGTMSATVNDNFVGENRRGISLSAGTVTFADSDFFGGRLIGTLDRNVVVANQDAGVDFFVAAWAKIAPTLSNSLIQGNRVGIDSSTYWTYDWSAYIRPTVANDTITGNEIGVREAVGYGDTRSQVAMRFRSSIVAGNGDDLFDVQHASQVRHCLVGDGDFAGVNGNLGSDPRFVDAAHGDYRLLASSPCVDAGSPELPLGAFRGLDLDGQARDVDGDRDGVRRVDMGAFEFSPNGLGWRYGNSGAAVGFPRDLLFVNGNAGDPDRIVQAPVGLPIRIDVAAPVGGPSPAPFVLFAYLGIPDATTASPQPRRVGTMSFPTPANGPTSQAVTLFNNVPSPAIRARLGEGRRASSPAPFSTTLPAALARAGRRITFQGVIADRASRHGAWAITNAVVVRVL